MRTRVKICGITNVADAELAASAGADAIGLIFHPASKRCITKETAKEILAALPAFVTPVALFVDVPSEQIIDTCHELALRHVQLQGHETPAQVAELTHLRVIKAIKVDRSRFISDLAIWRDAQLPNLAAILLETNTALAGGSGVENDWAAVKQAQDASAFIGLAPIIAAGGVTARNVASVIAQIHPWAVDVCSGTEQSPGRKSPEKVNAFVQAVWRGI